MASVFRTRWRGAIWFNFWNLLDFIGPTNGPVRATHCIMRPLLGLFLVIPACAGSASPEASNANSVRERLAQPTKLLVSPAQSSGSITARRYTHDGWQEGSTPVAIANGELDASAGATGDVAIGTFSIGAQPIDIPASVFGQPAQLTDVRLALAGTPAMTTTWTDDDDATATATIDLDLSWTIVIGTAATPLGTQHLQGIPVAITFTGGGAEVDAAIAAHADGTLWSWADLVQLTQLQLSLSATTVQ
jgi:hypothetical protein